MDEITRQLVKLRKGWQKLASGPRWAIGISSALLAVAVIAILLANAEPTMAVLFSNVSEDDELRIAERLSTMGVPQRVDEETNTILIPRERVHEVRLLLAAEGLPSGPGVGFEVFDQQRFGESEFSEQVKYHRALEGELGRTISHLAGVRRARVHLVLPKRSLFVNGDGGGSASVVLHLRPGWKVREEQAKGIVHLVASSVRGLAPERVTLVDGEGRKLGGGAEDSDGALASESLGFRRKVEQSKERAVQQLLDATMGAGRSLVRVAADVDFTREERTEETYNPEAIAPRSFQITEEGPGANRGAVAAGGVPGAPSNLPGGQAPENGGLGGGNSKRSETRNFEVSKVLRRSVEPVGQVTGLQVAVIVDGTWTGEGDQRTFEPLPKEELDKIRGLIASAAGIDEERGDRVTIESVPFVEMASYEPSLVERTIGPYTEHIPTMLWLLGGLIALLWVRKQVALMNERAAAAAAQTDANVTIKSLSEGEAAAETKARLLAASEPVVARSLGSGDEAQAPRGKLSAGKLDEIRRLASELAGQEPQAAARVVRSWLAGGSS